MYTLNCFINNTPVLTIQHLVRPACDIQPVLRKPGKTGALPIAQTRTDTELLFSLDGNLGKNWLCIAESTNQPGNSRQAVFRSKFPLNGSPLGRRSRPYQYPSGKNILMLTCEWRELVVQTFTEPIPPDFSKITNSLRDHCVHF